jgi:hypothetical protein
MANHTKTFGYTAFPVLRLEMLFRYCIFCYPAIQCNCSAYNVPPDAGLQKRAAFSTLIVGLAETGDRTRATCVTGSGVSPSAMHYDFLDTCYRHKVYVKLFFRLCRWDIQNAHTLHNTRCGFLQGLNWNNM